MKALPNLLVALLASAMAASAQEKPRKSMTFQPGAKTPDEAAAAAVKATPAPAKEVASGPLNAQGVDEPGQLATAFFTLLEKNLIEEAYTNLTKGSKIAERPEELRTLKARTTEAIQIFGPILGFEMVDHKTVGNSLLRRTYVSLGRDFPLRWRFYFYRSDKQWRLVDLRVDDRLAGLFDEPEEPRAPEPKP